MARFFFLSALLVGLSFGVGRLHRRFFDSALRITFFDVGQGDSALIEWPGGETWLVDGGGGMPGRDMGARVLFPELTRLGVLTLDELILSHPDQDHGLGFESLLASLEVRRLRFNAAFLKEGGLMGRLRRRAISKGVPLEAVTGELDLGKARFLSLRGTGKNDRTLVLSVEFEGCRVLFTGDMEAAGEKELLSRWPHMKTDLLKVPHHGSLTSSGQPLLESLEPKWAVVSAGRGNSYGHPRARVLERYRGQKVSVLRTDFHGFVRFELAKGEMKCESALGDCGKGRCRVTPLRADAGGAERWSPGSPRPSRSRGPSPPSS